MADRQSLAGGAKRRQPGTTGVEQAFGKRIKFLLIKRQLVIKWGQKRGNQTGYHGMSRCDEKNMKLNSFGNYGAILGMAQVFQLMSLMRLVRWRC